MTRNGPQVHNVTVLYTTVHNYKRQKISVHEAPGMQSNSKKIVDLTERYESTFQVGEEVS